MKRADGKPALALVGAALIKDPLPAAYGREHQQSRGYHVVYRQGQVNHCPGCGGTGWHVGRTMVECASCATAIAIGETGA